MRPQLYSSLINKHVNVPGWQRSDRSRGPRHGARVRATVHTERAQQLTQSADLLADVQSVPLVGDGLQHLLQGAVQLSVLLLRWPDSLTQTGEGRHLRAGIMTVRANSYRRHRFTAASRRLRGAQERGAAAAGGGGAEMNPGSEPRCGAADLPGAGTGLLCCGTRGRSR